MMIKLLCFVLLTLVCIFPIQAQPTSCLDAFRSFTPLEPEIHPTARNESYGHVAAWYADSRCIVVGSQTGLWLYGIDQPDSPLQLAQISERAIGNIAVNPVDSTIAFNVAQEPTVYLIHPDGTSTSLSASGEAVTSIAFSPDGSLLAVASAKIDDEIGLYYDPRVQIWNFSVQYQTELLIDDYYDAVNAIFFSPDNQYILTDSMRQGYIGNKVDYWDIANSTKLWSYEDELFRSIQQWSPNDPFLPFVAIMHDRIVALGGINGWLDYDDYYGTGIHIWDAKTQLRKLEIVVFERGIGVENELVDIAFNSDGTQIASGQTDGLIQFWNVSDGKQTRAFQSSLDLKAVSFSLDDRFLAVTGEREIQIWDIAEKRIHSVMQL